MASRLLIPEIAILGTEKQLFFRLLFQILLPLHHDNGLRAYWQHPREHRYASIPVPQTGGRQPKGAPTGDSGQDHPTQEGALCARPQGLARGPIYRIDSQPTLHPFIRLHADGLALLRTDTRSGLYHTVHDTEAHASFRHARGTIRVPKGGSRGFPDRHHKHQQAELRFSDGHARKGALRPDSPLAQALSSLSQGRRELSGGRPTHGYRRLPTHGRQHL